MRKERKVNSINVNFSYDFNHFNRRNTGFVTQKITTPVKEKKFAFPFKETGEETKEESKEEAKGVEEETKNNDFDDKNFIDSKLASIKMTPKLKYKFPKTSAHEIGWHSNTINELPKTALYNDNHKISYQKETRFVNNYMNSQHRNPFANTQPKLKSG